MKQILCFTLCKVNCFKCIRYPATCTNRQETFSRIFKKLPLTYKTKHNTLIGDSESTTKCHNKLRNSSQRQLIKLLISFWKGAGMIFHISKATHTIPFKKSSRKTDDVVPLRAVKRQEILRCMLHLQFGNSRETTHAFFVPLKLRSRKHVQKTYLTLYKVCLSTNFTNETKMSPVLQSDKKANLLKPFPSLTLIWVRLSCLLIPLFMSDTNYRHSIPGRCPLVFSQKRSSPLTLISLETDLWILVNNNANIQLAWC